MTPTAPSIIVSPPRAGAWVDLGLAAGVGIGSAALVLATTAAGPHAVAHHGSGSIDIAGAAFGVVAATPLLLWRRAPFAVFVVTAATAMVLAGVGHSPRVPLVATVALYLLAASRDERSPWRASMTAVVVGLLAAYIGTIAVADAAFPGVELSHTALAWTAAWFAGERTRLRRSQLADLKDRARRAVADAERDRQLAVAEERARIARDLHDSAGNAVNVIAVRAGAARLRHSQEPDRSLLALSAIEELARHTVADIDRIVGALRTDSGGADTAAHGLASLTDLVGVHRSVGLDVTIVTTGAPRPLDVAADQAAYRIVQESLTNAARHGTGTAHVALDFAATTVKLTVTNPMPVGCTARPGGGHGIIGMRERAALIGATFDAGDSDDDFRVRAVIPLRNGK